MSGDIGIIKASDGTILLKMWSIFWPESQKALIKHSHIYFEITIVEGGSGVYTVGNIDYPMQKGDIFIFASNELHHITKIGENGLDLLNIHFEPRYLWGNSVDSLSEENINLCFSHNKNFKNRIDAKNSSDLLRIFHKIKAEFKEGAPEYLLTVKSLMNLSLIKLIRDFNYTDNTLALSRDRLHSIRKVIQYIDSHLSDDLSLDLLSDIAGMSPNYFSTLFHSISGITLWDYINSKRIDKAISLLYDGDLSMLQIATLCGFNNATNFNKTFKKITGVTPREYKTSNYSKI